MPFVLMNNKMSASRFIFSSFYRIFSRIEFHQLWFRFPSPRSQVRNQYIPSDRVAFECVCVFFSLLALSMGSRRRLLVRCCWSSFAACLVDAIACQITESKLIKCKRERNKSALTLAHPIQDVCTHVHAFV